MTRHHSGIKPYNNYEGSRVKHPSAYNHRSHGYITPTVLDYDQDNFVDDILPTIFETGYRPRFGYPAEEPDYHHYESDPHYSKEPYYTQDYRNYHQPTPTPVYYSPNSYHHPTPSPIHHSAKQYQHQGEYLSNYQRYNNQILPHHQQAGQSYHHQPTPSPVYASTPAPYHSNALSYHSTPAPYHKSPAPYHHQATTAPYYQSSPQTYHHSPSPYYHSTPAPYHQPSPTPYQASPISDPLYYHHSSPSPEFRSTPSPVFRSTPPSPTFRSSPSPSFRSSPTASPAIPPSLDALFGAPPPSIVFEDDNDLQSLEHVISQLISIFSDFIISDLLP